MSYAPTFEDPHSVLTSEEQYHLVKSAPSQPAPGAPLSRTGLLRRQKLRSYVKPKQEDPDVGALPREELGMDWKINWQLNFHDVTPLHGAFHNLHWRGIVSESNGKLDKSKALVVQAKEDGEVPLYTVNANLADGNYIAVAKSVKQQLQRNKVFVNDGAVGSHRYFESKVRAISDSPALSHYLTLALNRTPTSYLESFPANNIAYISSAVKIADPAARGVVAGAFAAHNPTNGDVVLAGVTSSKGIRKALFDATSKSATASLEKTIAPLNASVVSINGKNVIVVSQDDYFLQQKLGAESKLSAAHNVFWSPVGIIRAWDAVTCTGENCTSRIGDLVEQVGNKSFVSTKLAGPNVLSQPNSVVFLVNDSTGFLPTLSKLNPTQAAQFLSAGYNGKGFAPFFATGFQGNQENTAKSFKKLLEDTKAPAFVVNTAVKGGNLSPVDLQKILTATTDGSAAQAKPAAGFTTLTPVAVLGDVKLQAGDASKEAQLVNFVKTANIAL